MTALAFPVPAGWNVKPLKATVTGCVNGIWGDEAAGGSDDIVCVRVADFDRGIDRVSTQRLTLRAVPPAERKVRVLKCGDLLLEKSGGGDLQPVGKVVLFNVELPAVSSNFIARMRVAPKHDPHFLCYLHNALYSARVNTRSIKQSTGIQNLDSGSYLAERVAVPEILEQRRIASYLDRETAKIDALIAAQSRIHSLLLEDLESFRFAVVTRGVHKTTTQPIDSAWVSHIPKHWQWRRIVTIAKMDSGHTPDRSISEYWDGGVPWVSLNDTAYLKNHDYISQTAKTITEAGMANSTAHLLPVGTVVFSRDATIGRCGILGRPMAVSQHFIAWLCGKEILPEFLLLALRAMSQELERVTMGATIATIGMPDVRQLSVPVPPLSEQREILATFEAHRCRVERSTEVSARLLRLLREYRSALITAAVTGQIDVTKPAGFDSQAPLAPPA